MKLTPLDVRQKRFDKSFRGYAPEEVERFLESVAQELEDLVRKNLSLEDALRAAGAELGRHQEREKTLQETMVTAQRICEDLKGQARKEAQIALADAERQAEKIVEGAHHKLVQLIEDINELKRQRVQFESQLRSLLDGHQRMLEAMRPSPEAEERIDDNVSFLAPKKAREG